MVRRYDWASVAGQIVQVYETVVGAGEQGAIADGVGWVVSAVVVPGPCGVVVDRVRLDRMHHRLEVARGSLATQTCFAGRAPPSSLATSGALDPARSLLLVDAAHAARAVAPDEMESAESDLSQALRGVLRRRRGPPAARRTRPDLAEPQRGLLGRAWRGASTTTS